MDRPPTTPLPLDKTPSAIAGMFDGIARRYDLLNHLLSAGLDRGWRNRAVEVLNLDGQETVLDLCTGTADLALALSARRRGARRVVGIDFAAQMLRHGKAKLARHPVGGRISLLRGDAVHIPLVDRSVDAVTIGFGIRNVVDPRSSLDEILRVLRSGGQVAILEFGEPRSAPVRAVYLWYFRRVLPLVGRWISQHRSAYSYLPVSVGGFHNPPAFCQLLESAGFAGVRAMPLTFGIVYLYTGGKPL